MCCASLAEQADNELVADVSLFFLSFFLSRYRGNELVADVGSRFITFCFLFFHCRVHVRPWLSG